MPQVGRKKFPYTSQGMKQAKDYSRRTGTPMSSSNNYRSPDQGRPRVPVSPMPMRKKPRRSPRPIGPGLAPPRGGQRGGSRMMRNPGLAPSPRRSRFGSKRPGVGPGNVRRRKTY